MYRLFKLVVIVLIILYPFSIYFGLSYFSPSQVGMFLLAIFILRVVVAKRQAPHRAKQMILTLIVGGILAALTWLFNNEKFLLWYPVGLSTVFFIIFTSSLFSPPTVVESIARMREPDLNAAGIAYTRKVTMIWSAFFVLNALIATWTVLHADIKLWTLYNGLLAYIAMGTLFAAEMVVRRYVRGK